jgi:hypothetical protein
MAGGGRRLPRRHRAVRGALDAVERCGITPDRFILEIKNGYRGPVTILVKKWGQEMGKLSGANWIVPPYRRMARASAYRRCF